MPLTNQQIREGAAYHAEQADRLLRAAAAEDAEAATLKKAAGPSAREAYRVQLAHAHALTAQVLATYVLPLGPQPPA
jgi:hypothetical protein